MTLNFYFFKLSTWLSLLVLILAVSLMGISILLPILYFPPWWSVRIGLVSVATIFSYQLLGVSLRLFLASPPYPYRK